MADPDADDHEAIEERIVGLHNVLYVDDLSREDVEFYELEEAEGEVLLPEIGLYEGWREWSTEKLVEVLIHEFAHTENYEDDHHPDFWDRVVELTEIAVAHEEEVAAVFDDEIDPEKLKRVVVDSVHEEVVETDVDTVAERRRAVAEALGVPDAARDRESEDDGHAR